MNLKRLTLDNDCVSLEDLELVHLRRSQLNDRVIVLLRLLNLKLVRSLLRVHDSRGIVFLSMSNDDRISTNVSLVIETYSTICQIFFNVY